MRFRPLAISSAVNSIPGKPDVNLAVGGQVQLILESELRFFQREHVADHSLLMEVGNCLVDHPFIDQRSLASLPMGKYPVATTSSGSPRFSTDDIQHVTFKPRSTIQIGISDGRRLCSSRVGRLVREWL